MGGERGREESVRGRREGAGRRDSRVGRPLTVEFDELLVLWRPARQASERVRSRRPPPSRTAPRATPSGCRTVHKAAAPDPTSALVHQRLYGIDVKHQHRCGRDVEGIVIPRPSMMWSTSSRFCLTSALSGRRVLTPAASLTVFLRRSRVLSTSSKTFVEGWHASAPVGSKGARIARWHV